MVAPRPRRGLSEEVGGDPAVRPVRHRPGVPGCRRERRSMREYAQLSDSASALRQGLHRDGTDFGTDLRAPHCGWETGGHRLLLPGDRGASHAPVPPPTTQSQQATAPQGLHAYELQTSSYGVTSSGSARGSPRSCYYQY